MLSGANKTIMLRVAVLVVIMLSAIVLNAIIMSLEMLNVILMSVIMCQISLCWIVIILSVVMLNVIIMIFVILNIIKMSFVMLNVIIMSALCWMSLHWVSLSRHTHCAAYFSLLTLGRFTLVWTNLASQVLDRDDPKAERWLSWNDYGPDHKLDIKTLQSVAKSLQNLEVFFMKNLLGKF